VELLSVWSFLTNPAYMTGAILVAIGGVGLLALLILYPFSRDY